MKWLKIVITTLFFLGVLGTLNAQNRRNLQTITFDVSLSCNNCKAKLEKHIPFERGVKDMTVDVANKKVTITYDIRKNDVDKLKKAIEALNFTCEIAPVPDAALFK